MNCLRSSQESISRSTDIRSRCRLQFLFYLFGKHSLLRARRLLHRMLFNLRYQFFSSLSDARKIETQIKATLIKSSRVLQLCPENPDYEKDEANLCNQRQSIRSEFRSRRALQAARNDRLGRVRRRLLGARREHAGARRNQENSQSVRRSNDGKASLSRNQDPSPLQTRQRDIDSRHDASAAVAVRLSRRLRRSRSNGERSSSHHPFRSAAHRRARTLLSLSDTARRQVHSLGRRSASRSETGEFAH